MLNHAPQSQLLQCSELHFSAKNCLSKSCMEGGYHTVPSLGVSTPEQCHWACIMQCVGEPTSEGSWGKSRHTEDGGGGGGGGGGVVCKSWVVDYIATVCMSPQAGGNPGMLEGIRAISIIGRYMQ